MASDLEMFLLHVETLGKSFVGLADLADQNTHNISSLLRISTQHQQSIEAHQQRFDAVINELQRQGEVVREMQSEVRGLQTENRRILDQLINREGG